MPPEIRSSPPLHTIPHAQAQYVRLENRGEDISLLLNEANGTRALVDPVDDGLRAATEAGYTNVRPG